MPESKSPKSKPLKEENASLKRKSRSASPAPPEESHKRTKLEDSPGRTVAQTETAASVEKELSKNGADKRRESRDEPSVARRDSRLSPVERRTSVNRREPSPPRRGGVSQEDKKRGRRLFGGLLGTLSQTTTGPNSQQKRRLEIERRQQEKAQMQKIEDDKRRTEKLSKLSKVRKAEQVKLDEQVVSDTAHETCWEALS